MGTIYTIILVAILIALYFVARHFVNKNKSKNNEATNITNEEILKGKAKNLVDNDLGEQPYPPDSLPFLVYTGCGLYDPSYDPYGTGHQIVFVPPEFVNFIQQFFNASAETGVDQCCFDAFHKLKKQKKAGKFEEKPDEIKTLINVLLEQIKVQMNSKMGEDERRKVNKTIELCEQLSTDNITDIDPEFFTSWIVSQSDPNLVRDGLRTLKQVSDNYFENGKKELSFYISHLVLLRVKNIMHLVPEKEINEMFAPKGDQQPEFLQFISTLNPNERYWNKLKEQSNGGGGNVITNRKKSKNRAPDELVRCSFFKLIFEV